MSKKIFENPWLSKMVLNFPQGFSMTYYGGSIAQLIKKKLHFEDVSKISLTLILRTFASIEYSYRVTALGNNV